MSARETLLVFARKTGEATNGEVVLPAGATRFVSTRGEPEALVVSEGDATEESISRSISPGFAITRSCRCRPVGTLPVSTEARTTRGLLVGATDCGDMNRLAEFDAFYDGVHAREVLDSALYWRARRLERVSGDETLPRFFALYESERDEPTTYRELRTKPMTTTWPDVFLVRGVWTFNRA